MLFPEEPGSGKLQQARKGAGGLVSEGEMYDRHTQANKGTKAVRTPPQMRATLPFSPHPRLPPQTLAQSSVSIAHEIIRKKHIQNARNKEDTRRWLRWLYCERLRRRCVSLSVYPRVNLSVAASAALSAHATVAHTYAQDTSHTPRGQMKKFFSRSLRQKKRIKKRENAIAYHEGAPFHTFWSIFPVFIVIVPS